MEESTAASGGSSATKWGLDRIDHPTLPLDNEYNYYNMGTGIHAYIIDTVGAVNMIASGRAAALLPHHCSVASLATLGCCIVALGL